MRQFLGWGFRSPARTWRWPRMRLRISSAGPGAPEGEPDAGARSGGGGRWRFLAMVADPCEELGGAVDGGFAAVVLMPIIQTARVWRQFIIVPGAPWVFCTR